MVKKKKKKSVEPEANCGWEEMTQIVWRITFDNVPEEL